MDLKNLYLKTKTQSPPEAPTPNPKIKRHERRIHNFSMVDKIKQNWVGISDKGSIGLSESSRDKSVADLKKSKD